MIRLENISKNYNEINALSEISFSMQKGEIVGLLGVNGAGKSTLMKILSCIIQPDTGQIFFEEKKMSSSQQEIKSRIGYLSEDNPLYDDMYVGEYLEYVAGIYRIEKSRIGEFIEKTGLQKEYKKKMRALSKGNRQRVGIAQALLHDPEFLILDEATSGLDPNQRESINQLLKELSADKVILFSTHILSEVKDICTRVILLDKGKLVADKRIEEIESIETLFHTLIKDENNS